MWNFGPDPVSFNCSECHGSWNGFLFGQKIWLTYSSNTSQNYLHYKIEVNFLEFFQSQYPPPPSPFVNRKVPKFTYFSMKGISFTIIFIIISLHFVKSWSTIKAMVKLDLVFCLFYYEELFLPKASMPGNVARGNQKLCKWNPSGSSRPWVTDLQQVNAPWVLLFVNLHR